MAAGLGLRPAHLSADSIEVLGLPGEIMLRLLKMLVLPLVAGSMVAGQAAMHCPCHLPIAALDCDYVSCSLSSFSAHSPMIRSLSPCIILLLATLACEACSLGPLQLIK